jgi:hypothetical protein
MGRLLNLDYKIEDIFNMINDTTLSDKNVSSIINAKADIKKQLYYEQLMKV